MKDKEKQIFKFSVIDNKTSEYPDLYNIALKEDWAKGLMYCDMEGFSINEDGQLILSDECGKFVYCPSDRFTVVFGDSIVLTREEYESDLTAQYDVAYEMASKETAEKIANRLIEIFSTAMGVCSGCALQYDKAKNPTAREFQFGKYKGFEVATKEVKELAKHFGVEIKE